MKQCSCCGSQQELKQVSRFRKDVKICSSCNLREAQQGRFQWAIDGERPISPNLQAYWEVRQEATYVRQMWWDDEVKMAQAKSAVEQAQKSRVPAWVIVIQASDGTYPYAEFQTENHARASVFGWLGERYDNNGKNSWVAEHGVVISYDQM